MARKRSGSGATNSTSVGGNAPTPPNPGVNIVGFNVGTPVGGKRSRGAKNPKAKTMRLANGQTSGLSVPPQ